jgi:hypothetical protein
MRSATRVTVSTFGILAGLAGIEHGVGEVLQGNQPPAGLVIESWPESEAFRILAGEPALTIVPNLLLSGILTIIASVVFLIWVTIFIERKHGAIVLLLLSIVLLLVGGGFGPPLLGIILSAAASQINGPLQWWRDHLSRGVRHFLARLWPWSFGAGLLAWLALLPGSVLAVALLRLDDANPRLGAIIYALMLAAFGLLGLTIVASFAHDVERQRGLLQTPVRSES